MPGRSTDESDVVCIASFESTVIVLASKTKPKKLVLLGTDGRR